MLVSRHIPRPRDPSRNLERQRSKAATSVATVRSIAASLGVEPHGPQLYRFGWNDEHEGKLATPHVQAGKKYMCIVTCGKEVGDETQDELQEVSMQLFGAGHQSYSHCRQSGYGQQVNLTATRVLKIMSHEMVMPSCM